MSKLRLRLADTLYPNQRGQDYGRYWPIDNNDPGRERPMQSDRQEQAVIDDNTAYLHDGARVKYRVDSDLNNDLPRDALYDVVPPRAAQDTPYGSVRVQVDLPARLQQHRDEAYQTHVVPPVHTATDPGHASYALPLGNDPREDEVRMFTEAAEATRARLSTEHAADLGTSQGRTQRWEDVTPVTLVFKVGQRVRHAREPLTGTVRWADEHGVAVAWGDQTRERFTLQAAQHELAYVDDAEDQVAPVGEPTMETPDDDSTLTKHADTAVEDLLNTALAALALPEEDPDEAELIEDGRPSVEVLQLQQQVQRYEGEKVAGLQAKAARELLELMKLKGMVTAEGEEAQYTSLLQLNEQGFNLFKQAVLSSTQKAAPTLSAAEEEGLAILHGRGGGSGGGGGAPRGISRAGGDEIGEGGYSLAQLDKGGSSPFQGLKGLTQPIQVQAAQGSGKEMLISELANLDWTVLTKQHRPL